MPRELSFLEFMEEPEGTDPADIEADEEEHREQHYHVPRPSKGPHHCIAHDMGVCPECGHLLWVHCAAGGCMYGSGGNSPCPCRVERPPDKLSTEEPLKNPAEDIN